ncbi:MAG: plasmid mobilization relaxosome protein MobC [Anaerolineaceae bacterium]
MVGININQIAHHLNATGNIYRSDIEAIKKMLDEIWQLQRSILSSLR